MGELGDIRQGMTTEGSSAGESAGAEHFEEQSEPKADEAAGNYQTGLSGDTGWVDERLASVLESLLFAAGDPVSLSQLANALEEVPRERIRKILSEMAAAYASSGRGLVLEEIAGGYQLRTPSANAVYVRRLLSAKPPRLSRPLLETLAIVAYRQPVTRPEIEQLRGVDSGGVLDTLMERNLVKIAGRKDGPGRPIIYTTTAEFLELFGLKDLESLPDLEEFRQLEGLRGPAEPPAELRATEMTQDANPDSRPDSEIAPQRLANEFAADLPGNQPDEKILQANATDAAWNDDAGRLSETDEIQTSQKNGGPDDD